MTRIASQHGHSAVTPGQPLAEACAVTGGPWAPLRAARPPIHTARRSPSDPGQHGGPRGAQPRRICRISPATGPKGCYETAAEPCRPSDRQAPLRPGQARPQRRLTHTADPTRTASREALRSLADLSRWPLRSAVGNTRPAEADRSAPVGLNPDCRVVSARREFETDHEDEASANHQARRSPGQPTAGQKGGTHRTCSETRTAIHSPTPCA